ncbi:MULTISPECIES: hypothetical protein [unclassified Halomonas]|uniref:hypothetical protein n=1 Tax=unclassified Halomonas TaxID=2609666 RepID=UPI0006D98065|nr:MULTISPECIES: hypothetical protein [unclassified Halomonas]KPQ22222.1 MAG: hypothetical protein HLUCCO06_04870 [Halomonas sp. HL-93]SBR48140.1 hypothetical protein GA0071314_1553 [Halomonas sp. HL-93]SNY95767.1 hypothetical protein SAMN04488142_0276 [Halomonas sp. hl-4]
MELANVNKGNIDDLYDLNAKLAESEKQRHLFTADRESYADAFLATTPACFGSLAYQDEQPVGFYIYNFKFASYIASRVLYVEDMYLVDGFDTDENKKLLLQHAVRRSQSEKCCRVEMRVLKAFNPGYGLIKSVGFSEITKWDVYRLDL